MKKFVSPTGTLELNCAWRRTLVVILYTLFVGLLVLRVRLPQPLPDSLIPIAQWSTLVGLIFMVAAALILHFATGGIADTHGNDLRPRPIDERQEKVRNQAYVSSYVLLGPSLLTLAFLTEYIALIWLFLTGLFLYASLPVAVLAWLEPDPISENRFEERTLA